jgi:hypothetical protein
VPIGKLLPLAGPAICEIVGKAPELSVAVAAEKLTTSVQAPGAVETVMFAGQEMTGGSLSATFTTKLQVDEFPNESVKVKLTGVEPMANALPLAGPPEVVTPVQLSVAVGL